MKHLILLGFLFAVAFAGCVGEANSTDELANEALSVLADPAERLSLASHPAYGYPSITDYSGLLGEVPNAWMLPPANELPDAISGFEHLAATAGFDGGAGIAVFGHYVFASGNGPGAVIDIADPANPVKVADLEADIRDADVIAHPDGTLTLVAASNGDIYLWDVTDPTQPEELGILPVSSHNAAVVPGTPLVYNAGSAGGGLTNPQGAYLGNGNGVTEIFDLTDPENPVQLDTFENGYGCHDITFFIDADNDKYRAYCAGIEMTQIWDIADPAAPEVIVNVPVHHGVAGTPSGSVFLALFSHLAMVNSDGTVLIVGDETGGGAAPGCDAYADAGAATVSGPLGNLWFYDITDETNPQLLSWFSPNNPITQASPIGEAEPIYNCTAHFGRIVQDLDMMVVGFYSSGTHLVDISDPTHPFIVDTFQQGGSVWDAWEWQGYVFTGDMNRGMDVLRLV